MSKRLDRFKKAGLVGCLNGRMNVEEWRIFKDDPPSVGDFIAAYREPFPSFYWMGTYQGVPNEEEDMFTHWFPLPIPPAAAQRVEDLLSKITYSDLLEEV